MSVNRPDMELQKSRSRWSLRTKIARALWKPFQILLFSRGPRALSPLRILSLRLFGAKIGKHVLISGGVKVWLPWNLSVGDYCAIGFDVEIYNFAPVLIGGSTVVSQYSYLCTASHRYEFTDMPLYWEPIEIGASAWLAAGVFVGPGITIGEGAVIGAQSVVTRQIPPWTVAAGNPARVLKARKLSKRDPHPSRDSN